MIRASIDIGSNSVLLLACELDASGKKIAKELLNGSHITSLGKDLDKTKMFHPESMQATYNALLDYKTQLEAIHFPPSSALVTATEAARVATNSSEFFAKIKNELGFTITIINSDAEAYFTAMGVASGSLDGSTSSVVIMDIGGASTELIKAQLNPFKIIDSISLPIGSVRAMDWLKENSFEQKTKNIFTNKLDFYQTSTLLCVAGGMTAMAAMYLGLKEFDAEKIDGMNIEFKSFKSFANDLEKTNLENLKLLFPFLGKRAEIMTAASKVALMFGTSLKIKNIKISTRGLRYGTILEGVIDAQYTVR
jgi:exopolyphosphatase/guanosine-5'-triphosphate,3'-diphosphate pyrophosphatase